MNFRFFPQISSRWRTVDVSLRQCFTPDRLRYCAVDGHARLWPRVSVKQRACSRAESRHLEETTKTHGLAALRSLAPGFHSSHTVRDNVVRHAMDAVSPLPTTHFLPII